MDEAFSALDPLIRTEMQDELVKLQSRHQRTIVFISHDLDEAMRIGDRIAIMQGGEVVQVGTPDEILNNPANDYVRTFFRGVDISHVFSAKDIARRSAAALIRKAPGLGPRSAIKLLQDNDREYGYVLEKQRFVGTVSVDSLKAALAEGAGLDRALLDSPRRCLPIPRLTICFPMSHRLLARCQSSAKRGSTSALFPKVCYCKHWIVTEASHE